MSEFEYTEREMESREREPMSLEQLERQTMLVEIAFNNGDSVKGFVKYEALTSMQYDIGGRERTYNFVVFNVKKKNGVLVIEKFVLNFNACQVAYAMYHRHFTDAFKNSLAGEGESVKKKGK